ncbi:MAG: hypothetical protein HYY01_10120 [Chloroflexi bacterium]|nr:hypothetical protein [Chloroflexota bacterium]
MSRRTQLGATLLETVLGLGLVAVIVPSLLSGLASAVSISDDAYDRSVLFELAQSQMEDVQRQTYQENAANYTLITAPEGYSISVSLTPAVTYTYPAPSSTASAQTAQVVTVTVSGVRGDLSLQAHKVRR